MSLYLLFSISSNLISFSVISSVSSVGILKIARSDNYSGFSIIASVVFSSVGAKLTTCSINSILFSADDSIAFSSVGTFITGSSDISYGISITVSVSSFSVDVALSFSDNFTGFSIIAFTTLPSLETLSIDCSFNSTRFSVHGAPSLS